MPPRLSAKSRSFRVDKSTSEMVQAEHLARVFRLEDKPGFLLRRLDARATLLYHKVTGQTDLTPRQFGVLLTLFQNEHITLTDLSQRIRIDKSTLGEMVQRMIERGMRYLAAGTDQGFLIAGANSRASALRALTPSHTIGSKKAS